MKRQPFSSRNLAFVVVLLLGLTAFALTSVAPSRARHAGASIVTQSTVLKLIDIKADPPCSTWGDITSCAPNGGAITWAGSYNTTYSWTQPPNEIGPGGASITLGVSQSNPP